MATLRRRVFVALPFYTLGRSSEDDKRPTLDSMRARLRTWLQVGGAKCPPAIETLRSAGPRLASLGFDLNIDVLPNSTLISATRSVFATRFLASGAELLLHIDDDIGAGPETLTELFAADADVIFAAYPRRMPPHAMTVHPLLDVHGKPVPWKEAPMRRTPAGSRVYEVASGALGLCLVKRRVVEDLVDEYSRDPEYLFDDVGRHVWIYREETADVGGGRRSIVGEDVAFMRRARAQGKIIELLADAPIVHDGIAGNVGAILDSGIPFEEEEIPTRTDRTVRRTS